MISSLPSKGLLNLLKISIVFLFFGISSQAFATHFRYGNITWSRNGNPFSIHFKVTQAWRRGFDYRTYDPTNPAPASAGGPSVNVGNVIKFGSNFPLNFGDGTAPANVNLTVTSISVTDDWFIGVFEVDHTYATTGTKTAFFEGSARISAPPRGLLQNNGDGTFRVETGVTVGNSNDAPVSTLPPFINMIVGKSNASYQIPATDPNGDALTFSLAPASSFTASNSTPLNAQPVGFSVSTTGLITFNTIGKTIGNFYNGILRLTDSKGAFINLDVLIKIVAASNPPVYDYSVTPVNNFTFSISPGTPVNFTVKAQDPDVADYVTLFANGIPTGATVSPSLPISGSVNAPVQTTFSWTPNLASVGSYVTTFIAQDPQGVQTPTTVKINVVCNTGFNSSKIDPSCPTTADGSITINVTSGTSPFSYSNDNGITYTSGASPFTFSNLSNGTYNLKVKEVNGCEASSSVLLAGIDKQIPTITAPADVSTTTNSGCSATGVALGTPTTADNCSVGSVKNDAPAAFPLGVTTVTWTVTDGSGNTATATQQVTVTDIINPTITAPADVSTTTNSGCSATGVALGTPTTADNCSVGSVKNDAPAAFPLGVTTVTWTVTDGSGNTATATQQVTVTDIINPTITAPADVSTTTNSGCSATGVALGTPTTADNCSVGSVKNDAPAAFPLGVTTVTWTVTDGSGNTATATQQVTVTDIINPTITAPADVSTTTNSGCSATGVALGTPTTADNCSVGSVKNDAPAAFPLGVTTVTWTVTDGSGNTATATQQVTVTDIINPTITAPADVSTTTNSGCSATGVALGTPTTADNCSVGSVKNDAPAAFPLGVTTVTWTVTDGSGNTTTATQQVTVKDIINPTITAPADVSTTTNSGCSATGVALGTPTTADNCSVGSVKNDAPAAFPLGVTTVTWTVTDGSGNTATATQQVTVKDIINPTITAPADVSTTTNSGCSATGVALGTPTTADNCSVGSVKNDAPAAFPLGVTTVTWTVTDGSGNTATATQQVTVKDIINPTITAPADVSTTTNSGCSATGVALGTPTTADNCSVGSVKNDAPAAFPLGVTTVTWTVTDGSGNTATSTQQVTVKDIINPTITAPMATTGTTNTGCTSTNVALGTPTTADNCHVASVKNDAPAAFPIGKTTVTWTVMDDAGNTATATQIVTVTDNINPTITAPMATTGTTNTGCTSTNVALGTPTTADNCHVASVKNDAPAAFPIGKTTVTWTVTDDAGNTATATQIVTVTDNINPTITAPMATTGTTNTGCTSTNVALGTPTTADNCHVASVKNDAPAAFPAGKTTVTWTVTDDAGNTATATQIVTVTDNINPTIKAPIAATGTTNTGCTSTNVALGTPTTADNCHVASVKNDAHAAFPIGKTTVTWTVTDDAGNTATATQIVTVTDNINPTITCPGNITVAPTTLAGTVVTFTTPSGSDNCSVASVVATSSLHSGSTFPIGVSTVTYKVTDGSGNTAVCSFTVTVQNPYCDKTPNQEKVYVCHKGNTICVSVNAWPAHQAHGDYLGACTATIASSTMNVATQTTAGQGEIKGIETAKELTVLATPNPTTSVFKLRLTSNDQNTPVTIRVVDAFGRSLNQFDKVAIGSTVTFGEGYLNGYYFAQVFQGTQRKVVKLVKGK